MSSKVRATYAKGSRQTERDVLARYKTCDLLVIDDWQWLGAPEKGHKIFFDVLDSRHRNERPTLVIMNVPTNEIARHLGPQITSRIERRGEIIACCWPKFGKPE